MIYGVKVVCEREAVYTVFPNDPTELPQDFETWQEAIEFGEETYGKGNYTVESATE